MLHFKINLSDRQLWIITVALALVFASGQLLQGIERSPSADDALFLSVPKNWLNGYGWATSYSEKIPFNPDFTGPAALLLPAALLIKLFGNQWWIAGVTGWLTNSLLAGLCLWQIRHYGQYRAITVLSLTCAIMAGYSHDYSSLIGYYSGSLLWLLAACIAFNANTPAFKRALLLGVLSSISLLIKPLLVPAFVLLNILFTVAASANKPSSNKKRLLATLLLPTLVVIGINSTLQERALADYSFAYRDAWLQYKTEFVQHHGSGIGQWLQAQDKTAYIARNANKNLYFVEEGLANFGLKNPWLGNEPADIYHLVGALYIITLFALLIIYGRKVCRNTASPFHWLTLSFTACILIYVLWFVLFAMAMSPGHLYFPLQWSSWLFFLLLAQLPHSTHLAHIAGKQKTTLLAILIVGLMFYMMRPDAVRNLLFIPSKNMPRTDALEQATLYLQREQFDLPLAGCGYSNYPRHLEYRLPASQNFSDCLDMIQDHVRLDGNHYRWHTPLAFIQVISLQSFALEPASSLVTAACQHRVLYRNRDVLFLQCNYEDLQKIDLNLLMPAIHRSHQWYKTRLSSGI